MGTISSIAWVWLDRFKGQWKPILLQSTVKTGTNQLGAPSDCGSATDLTRNRQKDFQYIDDDPHEYLFH